MPKFFKQILEAEGISQAQLSRASSVSTTTINKICTRNLGGADISATTKGKLIKAINKLVGAPTYKIHDIKFS